MLEAIEEKINYEIIKYEDTIELIKEDGIAKEKKKQIFELIIRAEKENNEKGIIIKNIDENNINMIIDKISNYTFSKVIEFLDDNSISYQKIEFI